MNPLFANIPTTVFEVMSGLARDTGAINLGQGFPDDPGPEDVRRKAADAVLDGYNQYPSMMGLPELRSAIAAHYAHWQGLDLDADTEVMVTSGATEALAGAILGAGRARRRGGAVRADVRRLSAAGAAGGRHPALRDPPAAAFPAHRGGAGAGVLAEDQGGRVQQSAQSDGDDLLRPRISPCWRISAGGSTPSRSPTRSGSTWSFDGRRHQPVLGLEGMRERSVKIGSAGKIFSLTGWKVGFVCAAPHDHEGAGEVAPVPHLHDAAEPAERRGLWPRQGRQPISTGMRRDLARSRDRFTAGLETLGFAVIPSQGTYFLNIDIAPLGETDDVAFCRRLVMEHGVAAIPGLGLLCRRRGQERGAVLLRQEGRDPRCGAGAARRARPQGQRDRLDQRGGVEHCAAGRCFLTRNLLASARSRSTFGVPPSMIRFLASLALASRPCDRRSRAGARRQRL